MPPSATTRVPAYAPSRAGLGRARRLSGQSTSHGRAGKAVGPADVRLRVSTAKRHSSGAEFRLLLRHLPRGLNDMRKRTNSYPGRLIPTRRAVMAGAGAGLLGGPRGGLPAGGKGGGPLVVAADAARGGGRRR